MQITFKTGKGELLFVKRPDEASDLTLPRVGMIDLYFQLKEETGIPEEDYMSIALPDLGYNIVELASEVTEEMAKELIPNSHYENIYPDYNFITDRMRAINFFNNALDSFKSILGHLEIDFNPIVLFKPNK